MYYTTFPTSLCPIVLAGTNDRLLHLHLQTNESTSSFTIPKTWVRHDTLFETIRDQLLEYLKGQRTTFTIPLHPQGTVFQQQVWKVLRSIPYGEVRTYKDIATAIGNPKACRAVGMANAKNPIPIIIPCHRVIGSHGQLTGFAPGLKAKKFLLDLEQSRLPAVGEPA